MSVDKMTDSLENIAKSAEELKAQIYNDAFEYLLGRVRETYSTQDYPQKKATLSQLSRISGAELGILDSRNGTVKIPAFPATF